MRPFQIKRMDKDDIEEVEGLFSEVIDELHGEETEKVRQSFKELYRGPRLRTSMEQKGSLCLVAEQEGKVFGFLLGGVTLGNIGNIYWLGVSPSHRKKGWGTQLTNEAVEEFLRRKCHQAELCAYSREEEAIRFFSRMGFQKKADIEKGLFGIGLVYMAKTLREVPVENTMLKIVLIGSAGQGIKLIGEVLGNILARLKKEVSLNVIYPPTVRTGSIEAELIYSDSKIEVPFIDKADLLLQLAKSDSNAYEAKEMVIEESIYDILSEESQVNGTEVKKELVSFGKISAETFGSPLFVNMLALGKLLTHIGINLEKVNFESLLPARNFSKNLEAIRYGYTHHLE